jgi:integrase
VSADGEVKLVDVQLDSNHAAAEVAALDAALRTLRGAGATLPEPRISDATASTLTLDELIEKFCSFQESRKKWRPKTAAENRAILKLFLAITGDQPARAFSNDKFELYRGKLLRLPPNLNKAPKYRDKAIDEVLAMAGVTPAAVKTINKNLTRVSSMFKWAAARNYVSHNLAAGSLVTDRSDPRDGKTPFTADELRKLFHNAYYLERRLGKPFQYWAPLIALYTGARQNEIAQLTLADFHEVDGIKAISINDDGEGKRLKTATAKRHVPLHPVLLDLGLWEFVELLRTRKAGRLFPEIALKRDGYGKPLADGLQVNCRSAGSWGKARITTPFATLLSII